MNEDDSFKIICHCGWHTAGTKADVVSETQEHVMKVHWVEVDEEDVLEMATPLSPDDPPPDSSPGSDMKLD
jgi:predicted small metal-binding protein